MGMFFKSRRQRIVDIYKKLQAGDSWEYEAEKIIVKYPKLELAEAILMGAYLERGKQAREFDEALKKLGVK